MPESILTALIVEDERKSALLLEKMIRAICPQIKLLGYAEDIEEAIQKIQLLDPELLFLDIEMPGGNGFDLLRNFDPLPFRVIFTTAYDQYALDAIKCNALDYLLKPIQEQELRNAVHKIQSLPTFTDRTQLLHVLQQLYPEHPARKLAISTTEGLLFVEPASIMSLHADGSYTKIKLLNNSQTILVSKNIKEFESLLPSFFFRIHHAHIVNLSFISRYIKGRGGYVVMQDGSEIEVSVRRKDAFLEIFK